MTPPPALYVDLDGTLISTDLLHESLLQLVRASPGTLLRLPLLLLEGKAAFKHEVASRIDLDATTLPYRPEVLDLLRQARAEGRRVVLATASDARLAERVARHLGLFDAVLASNGVHNLSGAAKLEAIRVDAGDRPFGYAGNDAVDLQVWQGAASAVVVSRSAALARGAASVTWVEAVIRPAATGLHRYLYGFRLHQWLKNLLVFMPLMPVLHDLTWQLVLNASLAFLAFGLMASSIYVFNDLLDLPSDRRHPRKKKRPFAAGDITPARGLAMSVTLCAASLALSLTLLPLAFTGVLLFYMVLTTAYSVSLKRRAVVDVFALAGLYAVRMAAGAAATGLPLSFWMLSFALFIFISLAMAKRYVELTSAEGENRQMEKDRGYYAVDRPFVLCAGVAAGQMSALLLSLYIHDQDMTGRYETPELLWALIPVFLYWAMRIWMKAVRGVLHEDPVVFAAQDWASRLAVGIAAGVLWFAG